MAVKQKKRKPLPKHLTARSLTLEDAQGKPRIFLDAGNGDGRVTICLFGEHDRSIQISTTPAGGLHISLLGQRGTVSTTLGMTPHEDAGLCIHDRQGRLGTMLGSSLPDGEHRLMLFQDGRHHWSTPQPVKPKKRK